MPNLPVPTWASEVPGNFVTSALWNANVYNNGTFLTTPPTFVGTQSVAQSMGNNSWVALTLDTSQIDGYGGHSLVTNTSRWTCPTGVPGWYTCCGVVVFTQNGTGSRGARLQVNGTAIKGAACFLPTVTTSNDPGVATPTRDIFLNVGDYIEVAGWQSSGGSLNSACDPDLSSALYVRFSHA